MALNPVPNFLAGNPYLWERAHDRGACKGLEDKVAQVCGKRSERVLPQAADWHQKRVKALEIIEKNESRATTERGLTELRRLYGAPVLTQLLSPLEKSCVQQEEELLIQLSLFPKRLEEAGGDIDLLSHSHLTELQAHPDCVLSLDLSSAPLQDNLTDDKLESLLLQFPCITSIDLSGCYRLTEKAVLLLQQLPHLERLKARSFASLFEEVSEYRDFHSLTELDLSYTRTKDATVAWISRLPNLKKLSLEFTSVTKDGISHLKGCKSLVELNLSVISNLTESVFKDISEIPLLNTLIIRHIKIECLDPFVSMPHLKFLDITGAYIYDRNQILALRSKRPDLTIIHN